MDDAKARRRIDALLATARHPNTAPTVAQAYLAKAAELRIRYNVNPDAPHHCPGNGPDTKDTGVSWWDFHVPDTGGRGAACAAGLAYVIDACGGMSVRGRARSAGGYQVTVVAAEGAMALICELVPVVLEQMHHRAVAECRRWRAERYGGATDAEARRWREDYVRAFGFGLAEQINTGNRDLVAEGEAGRAAGMVLAADRTRVQAAYRRRYGGRVRTVPAHGARHAQALEAGWRDGRTSAPHTRSGA